MKKTLAAVLAAAMALSTATVAFAADSQDVEIAGDMASDADSASVGDKGAKMGDTSKFSIGKISGISARSDDATLTEIDAEELAKFIDDGVIKPTVVVTSGKANLASAPSIKIVSTKDKGEQAQLHFKINHTYGTGSSKVTMKVRFTVAKTIYEGAGGDDQGKLTTAGKYKDADKKDQDNYEFLKKGDTLIGPEITYKAEYGEVDYGKEMTITLQEVKDNYVLAKGEDMYAHAGSDDKVSIYFDNYASVDLKVSPAQKDLNLYYAIGEIDEVPELAQLSSEYRDIDFEFITFKGKRASTTFTNSAEMTFNAIGGKNTQVYFLDSSSGGDDDGIWLEPLTGTYEPTLGTVTVKGIKRLSGSFVVASEMLEIENEEDNEPVDSAPVVEEPSSSEPTTVVEKNPSTGAC